LATIADSDGQRADVVNPKLLSRKVRKLRRLEREKSRRQKGSNNREKTRQRVAVAHNEVARARRDFHHKQALALVRDNQVIHVEDLHIGGMIRNRRLARAISDAGWGQFLRIIAERPTATVVACIRCHAGLPRVRPARTAGIASANSRCRPGSGRARPARRSTTATTMPPRSFSPLGGRRDETPPTPVGGTDSGPGGAHVRPQPVAAASNEAGSTPTAA
jgi:putative transposase